jgi:hypothetical protein
MKWKSSLLLLIFFHCSPLLNAQSGTHIICDDIEDKVIFYGEGTVALDESAINILDLADFKLSFYPMSDSDKPDFSLSYHDTTIQDFFISHNNLHVVLEQPPHNDFSPNPRNYLMEIIWYY